MYGRRHRFSRLSCHSSGHPASRVSVLTPWLAALFALVALLAAPAPTTLSAQIDPLATPLSQEILDLLANEISGQLAHDNMVRLAGAPWMRAAEELEAGGTFYESALILELARGYGIETVRMERSPREGSFDYPLGGELWITAPDRRLVARLGADAALVARGSQTADATGGLIYIPPVSQQEASSIVAGGGRSDWAGKWALMWSFPRGVQAEALDAAGVVGVISFSSRDRCLDPDQVVYSSGTFNGENLKLGMSVSWRQWSELFEDVQLGVPVEIRGWAEVASFPDRFETVYAWIEGTEPDEEGVVFTAHLFEGYLKRGANDNMGGCVVQLEILRALQALIDRGDLPRPRRTIHFVWPNEISGTYDFIQRHEGFHDRLSVNINMDMVTESLRLNNSWFTMSECPDHLPSYLDGLADAVMNYVWRTNDIVYLPDAPRGRPGGQYFPDPLWEKNGSRDAFRYFAHTATGGSDHLCFNNSSVRVPGIEFFTWPDQWYHADADRPDKGDPTQMRRVAFIGAACAWAAADCNDEVVGPLADAVTRYGFRRVGERELPQAMAMVQTADASTIQQSSRQALNLVRFAAERERSALASVRAISTGSRTAQAAVGDRGWQMEFYQEALQEQVLAYARRRAASLGVGAPMAPPPSSREAELERIVPRLTREVYGRLFSLNESEAYRDWVEAHPTGLRETGLSSSHQRAVLNFLDGSRSVVRIRDNVAAQTRQSVDLEAVLAYLEILREVGWVEWSSND